MVWRGLLILVLIAGSSFGVEIGAELGSALPVGGLETYNRSGLSGSIYGAVGEKVNLTLELGYVMLAGKNNGYQLTLTGLQLNVGYPVFKRSNSSIGPVAGAGVVLFQREIGGNRESGPALSISVGGRWSQTGGKIRTRLELLPTFITDGKGWAAVVGIRLGAGL
jgi:hypothetical protein